MWLFETRFKTRHRTAAITKCWMKADEKRSEDVYEGREKLEAEASAHRKSRWLRKEKRTEVKQERRTGSELVRRKISEVSRAQRADYLWHICPLLGVLRGLGYQINQTHDWTWPWTSSKNKKIAHHQQLIQMFHITADTDVPQHCMYKCRYRCSIANTDVPYQDVDTDAPMLIQMFHCRYRCSTAAPPPT